MPNPPASSAIRLRLEQLDKLLKSSQPEFLEGMFKGVTPGTLKDEGSKNPKMSLEEWYNKYKKGNRSPADAERAKELIGKRWKDAVTESAFRIWDNMPDDPTTREEFRDVKEWHENQKKNKTEVKLIDEGEE